MKRCPRCGETKPLDAFYNQKGRKDGKAPYCKLCRKDQKNQYLEDPENRAAYNQNIADRRRIRYADEITYKLHRLNQNSTRQRGAMYTKEALQYIEFFSDDACVYCGKPSESVDHIDPVSQGGSSDWDNLAPACGSCNSSKNNSTLLTFLLRRKGRD